MANDVVTQNDSSASVPADLNKRGLSPETRAEIRSYLLILVCNIIRAFGIHYFVLPYSFAPGGITGIAAMLNYKLPFLDTGIYLIALNAPLIVMSFFVFSKRFAFKTMIGLVLSSAFLVILAQFDKISLGADIKERLSVGEQTILAAIAGGVLSGIGLSIIMRAGASNGGTEVIGGFIQRKAPQFNVSFLISVMDGTVILASFFVYDNGLAAVLLALIQVFCYSKVSDVILSGFKAAIKVEIVTDTPEELGKEIIQKLARGVTTVNAMGMYSHIQKYLLVSVIRKRQLPDLYKLLKNYPGSFAYIIPASEVIGRGFSSLPVAKPAKPAITSVRTHSGLKNKKNIRTKRNPK